MNEELIDQENVYHFSPNSIVCDLVLAGDKVRICGKTGKVTLKDIEPDEAARAFWDAVQNRFPNKP